MEALVMNRWLLAVGVAASLLAGTQVADAHGWVGVGINIGFPVYRPYCGPYCYPYYRPYYPVYVAPAPVYVAPAPVYAEPPPAYAAPVPVVRSSAPPSYGQEPPATTQPVSARQPDVQRLFQMLNDSEERVRSDAAMDLGRLKVQSAVDVLCNVLANDRSSLVRETAARALGLIGSPRSLQALQTAAQVDNDRDVRRSAQFSAEVIRANLR
jgi:hypothetical protein